MQKTNYFFSKLLLGSALFFLLSLFIFSVSSADVLLEQDEYDGTTSHYGTAGTYEDDLVIQEIDCADVDGEIEEIMIYTSGNGASSLYTRVVLDNSATSSAVFTPAWTSSPNVSTSTVVFDPAFDCSANVGVIPMKLFGEVDSEPNWLGYPQGHSVDQYSGGELIDGEGSRVDLRFTIYGTPTPPETSTTTSTTIEINMASTTLAIEEMTEQFQYFFMFLVWVIVVLIMVLFYRSL